MKKVLIIGLVLILGLAILSGCPRPAPAPEPTPEETPTPEATPTPNNNMNNNNNNWNNEERQDIGYISDVEIMAAQQESPQEEDYQEVTNRQVPANTRSISVTLDRAQDAPEDRQIDVRLYREDEDEPIAANVVLTRNLRQNDVTAELTAPMELEPGNYWVVLQDRTTRDVHSVPLTVMRPGDQPNNMTPTPTPTPTPNN
jgi:hypothetical protein